MTMTSLQTLLTTVDHLKRLRVEGSISDENRKVRISIILSKLQACASQSGMPGKLNEPRAEEM